ncbi:MAG TPA: hypothetical protein VKV74_14010 [Bryobacteraceae bacterium]|nr:hypothetical protein [Bryobacteraceae bacterium]
MSLTYDPNNSLEITWHKVSFATAKVGETDGIASAVAKCGVDKICQ